MALVLTLRVAHNQRRHKRRGSPVEMKKLMLVFGTRPEAIKMAPLILEAKKWPGMKPVVCVTGQHREMIDQVLKVFEIIPDYDLNIMRPGQDLYEVTARALTGLREILKRENPGIVLVQGDTTTAFAGSLAAYYLKLPVGHIEAGLRTHRKYNPFPEEKNRHLISVLADYHFAPTQEAQSNLLREGVPKERIWVTGNTVIDALLLMVRRQKGEAKEEALAAYFKERWGLNLSGGNGRRKIILVTGHRRESFGTGLRNVCLAIQEAAQRRDVLIVYAVHLNPYVQRPVRDILNGVPNIFLTDPLEYEPFVYLMENAYLILTDSGGIQEEAPSLGKPVLVMRNTTERPEGVAAGTSKLVGTDPARIVKEICELLDNKSSYKKMAKMVNPYGDGKAAQKILRALFAEMESPSSTHRLLKKKEPLESSWVQS